MKKRQYSCQLIQENIAWNRELSETEKMHIISCPACAEVAAQVTELDALLKEINQPDVPSGFADRIMVRILEEEQREKDWFLRISDTIENIFLFKPTQWILVVSSIVVSFFNLFRFFFGFLFPAFG